MKYVVNFGNKNHIIKRKVGGLQFSSIKKAQSYAKKCNDNYALLTQNFDALNKSTHFNSPTYFIEEDDKK